MFKIRITLWVFYMLRVRDFLGKFTHKAIELKFMILNCFITLDPTKSFCPKMESSKNYYAKQNVPHYTELYYKHQIFDMSACNSLV